MDVGHGHLSIHRALFEKFKQMFPDPKIVTLKELELTAEMNQLKRLLTFRLYEKMVDIFPNLYGKLYDRINTYSQKTLIDQHRMVMSDNLRSAISKEDPDMIINSHVGGEYFSRILLEEGLIRKNVSRICFNTDFAYGSSYNVECTLIQPHEKLKEKMEIDFNRPPETTEVIPGLLAKPEFTSSYSKFKMRFELKKTLLESTGIRINLSNPILLVAGGGGGLRLKRVYKFLPHWQPSRPITVPFVTGKNESLYKKLIALKQSGQLHPNLTLIPLGYVNNMHIFMKAADILISKPGGATTAEVTAVNLAQFAPDYIPGQERLNLDFLTSIGVLHHVKKMDELNDIDQALWIAKKIRTAQRREFPERKTAVERIPGLFWKIFWKSNPSPSALTCRLALSASFE